MSNGYNYNPIPPRVWSRVQNPCTFIVPGSDYTQAFIPLTGQNVSQAEADYETKQIYKGNILQYKGNSARLTKSQKYSQLARCAGPNRTKVFATQSETYTNPNTTGLLRVGFQTYPFPNQIVGAPNNISGPFEYNIPNPNDCSGNSIQDGGTLVCGTYSNPCTGEIIKQGTYSATICNPASASNVPGSSILCWNTKVQTWFPRQRYFMNNSTDKWPINYKGFISAVKPYPPVLILDNVIDNNVFLSWTYENNNCIPISSFKLYQIVNGVTNLIKIIPFPISSTEVSNLINCIDYTFYITALSNNVESDKSNEVSIFIRVLYPTTITSITTGCESATLSWVDPNISCINITEYYVYQDGTKIATLAPNVFTYTATGLTTCTDYNYNISYFDSISNKESYLSNTAAVTQIPCPPTINSITFDYTTNSQNISFSAPIATCVFNYYNLYQTITPTDLYTPIAIPGIYPGNYNLTAANLQLPSSASQGEHTFYMTSFSNTNMTESLSSNVFSIPPPPINLSGYYTTTSGQIQLYWNNQNPTTGLTITQNKIYVKNLTLGGYTTHLIIPSSSYLLFGLTPSDSYEISATEIASSNSTESILSKSITMIPSINTISLRITSFSGNYTSGINGPITWYKFVLSGTTTSSGTVQLISSLTNPNCQINFCIIGGGDSGGGNNVSTQFNYGGGGGGIYYSTGVTVNTFTNFTLQVGQAGLNSNSGIYPRIQSPTSSILSSYISTGASQTIAGSGNYNGGNGGVGEATTGQDGFSSSFQTSIGNFSGPDGNIYTLGGGGGSSKSFTGGLAGGGLAGNGIGGKAGFNSNFNGQNASANSNNFGGGGGGCYWNPFVPYRPGNGNPGAVFIWWTTIQ